MFHVQLRQFPNQARGFNLSREELEARILGPWAAGEAVVWDERKWSPDKARLTIYEGPELKPEEIGMGRGWGNATRHGEDVTERLLAGAARPSPRADALTALKEILVRRCAAHELAIGDAAALASELHPEWRASDRLAVAEQAVWELLHRGALTLNDEYGEVERERWQSVMLSWGTWTSGEKYFLRTTP